MTAAARCLGAWLVVGVVVASHGPAQGVNDGLFTLEGELEALRVAADTNGVSADRALLALGQTMGWRVDFETPQLRDVLAMVTLDLAFDLQPPRVVAQLLAGAGGADVVFDDRTDDGAQKLRVHVVSQPDPELESGRRRLRQWAIQWYHGFLQREQAYDPLVEEEGMRVRMQLAEIKLQQGDVEGAAATFQVVYDADQTHPFAPLAMLRIAECNFELNRLEDAEKWTRRVVDLHSSRPEMAAAVVLLGRILIGASRYDECVRELRSNLLPLADTPEVIDVYLLIAEAQSHRERPDEVFKTANILAGSKGFRDLTERQFRDYWFLRGLGALGVGENAAAMEACELFIGMSEEDPRRGRAMLMLAETYLALDRFLEARASSLAAMRLLGDLEREDRRRARIVHARTALALGDREQAFGDLEIEVRTPGADPELVLFLVDAFLDEKRFQKALNTTDLLTDRDDHVGEQARLRKLQALLGQARDDLTALEAFAAVAVPLAAQITDTDLQRRAAELIGSAYEQLGDRQRAADAYRGVLR